MRERVVQQSSGNQSGRVRDVSQQDGAHFVGDLTELRVIPFTGIRGRSTDDHLGLLGPGSFRHFVHVDGAGLLLHPVKRGTVQFAAVVHRRTVGQVTSVGQIKPKDRVAWLEAGQHHRAVRRRP